MAGLAFDSSRPWPAPDDPLDKQTHDRSDRGPSENRARHSAIDAIVAVRLHPQKAKRSANCRTDHSTDDSSGNSSMRLTAGFFLESGYTAVVRKSLVSTDAAGDPMGARCCGPTASREAAAESIGTSCRPKPLTGCAMAQAEFVINPRSMKHRERAFILFGLDARGLYPTGAT